MLALSSVRYLIVGAANTLVGYSLIFVTMIAGAGHVAANAIGYSVGFLVSFTLNRRWTFASSASVERALPRFLLVTLTAYAANLVAVVIAIDAVHLDKYIGQLCGLGPYLVVGYLGSRYFAFRDGGRLD